MRTLYEIRRGILLVLFLSLSAVVFFSPRLEAKVPRPATISRLDNSVKSEPGEDPHLKIEPIIKVEPVSSYGSSSGLVRSDDGRDMLGQQMRYDGRAGYKGVLDYGLLLKLLLNSLMWDLNF